MSEGTHPYDGLTPEVILNAVESAGFRLTEQRDFPRDNYYLRFAVSRD